MNTLDEIRKFFASLSRGATLIRTLPEEYPAYIIRTPDWFGVAVEWDGDTAVSEHFANARICSTKMFLGGEEKSLLLFFSCHEYLRNEFASVCAQFVDPGKDGHDRIALRSDPLSWWKKWKNLLGNTIADHTPYSVLCEMMVLEHIYSTDRSAQWTATQSGTHDIEADQKSYEVKSTIRRYGADITISGQFQLLTPKPLDLYFCRVEESPAGISINDMCIRLDEAGYDRQLLEHQLAVLGYELGASARDMKYTVLEKRIYNVDDSFPKITEASFKDDKMPDGITHITYTVDLENIPYTVW